MDLEESADSAAKPKRTSIERIAIAREGQPTVEATLYREGEKYLIGLSGEGAEALRELFERQRGPVDGDSPPENTLERATTRWDLLKEDLAKEGFSVTSLPFPEYRMHISVDLNTGTILAPPAEGATGNEPHNASLEAAIFASVGRALRGMGEKVVEDMEAALASDNHPEAARILIERAESVSVRFSARKLLRTATRIRVEQLSRDHAAKVLLHRVALATVVGRYDSDVGSDLTLLRESFSDKVPPTRAAALETASGLVELHQGKRESAFTIFKAVAERRDNVSSGDRAWAYRNLSTMLNRSDAEAARFAELSADAFLECGNRHEAAKSISRLAECILADSPEDALRRLDEVIIWFSGHEPLEAERRAGVFHLRADALLRLGRAKEAATSAMRASEERVGLRGAELARAASLALASVAMKQGGDFAGAVDLASTAATLRNDHRQVGDLHDDLLDAIERGDNESIDRIAQEAESRGNVKIAAVARISSANGKGGADALKNFEMALASLEAANAPADDIALAELAVGDCLLELDEPARALPHFERILRLDPLRHEARQNYPTILWQLGRWREAASFFERELVRFPDRPGLLYGLGRSLLEMGQPGRAIVPLTKASRLLEADSDLKRRVDELLDRALNLDPVAEVIPVMRRPPLTRRELEVCLSDLQEFIQAEKRMTFWQPTSPGKHKWVFSPERAAQDLVHTFVKARFGDRIQVFEELDCGAGRLDVFLVADGGLSAVLELKMLGQPYTTTYAFSGKEQIAHYMGQKKCHIGYLLIFDGRARDFGTGLSRSELVGESTVMVTFIDLRRSVKGNDSEPSV